jgi:hypothetical protein
MKLPVPGALAFAALLALTACDPISANSPEPVAPTGQLRVLHASPDAPNVDVYVDGARVLSDVPYKVASGYLEVPAGARRIEVKAAGTSTTVIDVSPTLAANAIYTAIATGLVADIAPLLLTDDLAAPGSGNVKVRVVHGAPSAPEVDVYVTAPGADLGTATPVLTDVPFEAASPYLEVPAGTYQVRVTVANTTNVAIDTGALTLTAGQIRTAVAVDAPGGGAPFSVVLLADKN